MSCYVKKHRELKRKRSLSPFIEYINNLSGEWNVTRSSFDDSGSRNYMDDVGPNVSNDNVESTVVHSYRINTSGTHSPPAPLASSSMLESPLSQQVSPYQSRECDIICNNIASVIESEISSTNSNSWIHCEEDQAPCEEHNGHRRRTLQEKLKQVFLENISTITHKCITQLLMVLRSEGFNLPKCASTLLGTRYMTFNPIKPMQSLTTSLGVYRYFGIQENLKRRVSSIIMDNTEVLKVLVNVDGVPIFQNSHQQFWPILMQVYSEEYLCRPFLVALFHGDSKPLNVNEYLNDFIDEVTFLTNNGITIQDKTYGFELQGIVCDTPARAFLKKCKGHTGFYACERCETRGVSIQTKTGYKRIYPETSAKRRSTVSFAARDAPEHHLNGSPSPLLQLQNFNIINGVVLDYMQLLCIGVMKQLMNKWVKGRYPCRLSVQKMEKLQQLLDSVTKSVPCEFQRKVFKLAHIADWKATQFRFLLLYYGSLLAYHVLNKDQYKHFMLLFTASRILSDETLARVPEYVDVAEKYLVNFFLISPAYYGQGIQVMNFHNLIHLADDVRYMNAPISYFSSFPFENSLSFIKSLVRNPLKPLSQVSRRISELESGSDLMLKRHALFTIDGEKVDVNINRRDHYREITYEHFTLRVKNPDNIVQLEDGNICVIDSIILKHEVDVITCEDLCFIGRNYIQVKSAAKYPQDSEFVGFMEVSSLSKTRKTVPLKFIRTKCILFDIDGKTFVTTLLHQ